MEITIEQPVTGEKTNISKLYNVVATEGLTPVAATINTTGNGVVDGTFYNSSFLSERNIILTMVPGGDIEEKRLELYKIFRPKSLVKVYVKSRFRNVYIESRVESVEPNLHVKQQSITVSLIAPQPYFLNVDEKVYNQTAVISDLEIPFEIPQEGLEFGNITKERDITIVNEGEETSGLIMEIIATDTAVNPVIYNKTTREKFCIREQMLRGDKIEINTHKGQKKIEMNRGSVKTNLLNKIEKNSKWLTVETGKNIFSYGCVAGEENIRIKYRFNEMYGGV